jgi:phosphopantothenoylcysteine decarboxylase/phosphopantothenate--cysteine ligase
MWDNPIVQENLQKLTALGYHLVEPGIGRLACGTEGKGRLADIELIEASILSLLAGKRDFFGRKILVTAGPTMEPLDPVRFLTNHSTGRMGYEIARAARERGADVTLVSGPTALPDPTGVRVLRVNSAMDMYTRVLEIFPETDIVIKTAAVADYRPKQTAAQKIKKANGDLTLVLERNPDILWELGRIKKNQILIGFAAETEHLLDYARDKMAGKNLDMIVANNVTEKGAGFGGETNKVSLLFPDGSCDQLPQLTKYQTAHAILDRIGVLAVGH